MNLSVKNFTAYYHAQRNLYTYDLSKVVENRKQDALDMNWEVITDQAKNLIRIMEEYHPELVIATTKLKKKFGRDVFGLKSHWIGEDIGETYWDYYETEELKGMTIPELIKEITG